jgi:hypothetical protein
LLNSSILRLGALSTGCVRTSPALGLKLVAHLIPVGAHRMLIQCSCIVWLDRGRVRQVCCFLPRSQFRHLPCPLQLPRAATAVLGYVMQLNPEPQRPW